MKRNDWMVVAGFLLAQLLAIVFFANGPFVDEGLYASSGGGILLGWAGNEDWFGGCPYFGPVLVAAGYLAAGLPGARLTATLLYAAALVFFAGFCRRRFGQAAASWALLLLCLNGLFFSFAHLATYDAAAFLGFAACLWSMAELAETGRLRYAVSAGLCAATAIIARYWTFVVVLPSFALCMIESPKIRRAHLMTSFSIAAASLSAYFFISYRALLPPAAALWTDHSSRLSRPLLAFGAVYGLALPLSLAAAGFASFARTAPRFTAVMVGLGLLTPTLHVLFAQHVSFHKDLTFAMLYLYPLAGVSIHRLYQRRPTLATCIVGAVMLWGGAQWYWEDHSWADVRGAASFLFARMGRGETLAATDANAFGMYAVLDHDAPPEAVTDRWPYDRGADPCRNDWIVGAMGGQGGDFFVGAALRCGFDEIARFESHYFYVAPPLVGRAPVEFVIFRRPPGKHFRRARLD